MLQTKTEQEVYQEKTVYISDESGEINKIRVELDQPVQLTKVSETDILITVTAYHTGCDIY